MTDYYFDFDNGDDANTGPYTASNALKNLPGTAEATGNAVFNPTAGDVLSLAKGDVWEISDRWHFTDADSGTSGNPITVVAHDAPGETGQAQPIVSLFETFASIDWTLSPTSGVWYASLKANANTVNRVFFDWVGQKSGATSEITVTASLPWWFDNTNDRIYAYSGSDTLNPSDIYSDVRCTCNNSTSTAGAATLDLDRASYVHFDGIHFRGGDLYTVLLRKRTLGVVGGGYELKNCTIDYSGQKGIHTITVVLEDFDDYIRIENNHVNARWSKLENTGTASTVNDGISIKGNIKSNLWISGNRVFDYGHSGININNTSAANNPIDGAWIFQNFISCPNTDYGRGIAINGTHATTRVTNIWCYRNTIYNTNTRNQIEGVNIYFFGNVVSKVRASVATANTSQGITVTSRNTAAVDNVIIGHNLVINSDEEAYRLQSGAGFPVVSAHFFNNIAIKGVGTSDLCFDFNDNDVGTGTVEVENNKFYSTETTTVIDWDGTTYTVTAADAAVAEMQNNLGTSESLSSDNDYLIARTSDCVGAGRYVTELAMQEGFNGEPFASISVDIGPNQTTYNAFHPVNL